MVIMAQCLRYSFQRYFYFIQWLIHFVRSGKNRNANDFFGFIDFLLLLLLLPTSFISTQFHFFDTLPTSHHFWTFVCVWKTLRENFADANEWIIIFCSSWKLQEIPNWEKCGKHFLLQIHMSRHTNNSSCVLNFFSTLSQFVQKIWGIGKIWVGFWLCAAIVVV